MEMASARRRARQVSGDHVVLLSACVVLISVTLLLAVAVSSGFGAAGLAGEIKVVVRTTSAPAAVENVVGGRRYCGEDDRDSMFVDGEWVRDEAELRYPLYQSRDCPFIDVGFRCGENGRPDDGYARWTWRPRRCTLPRSVVSSLFYTWVVSCGCGWHACPIWAVHLRDPIAMKLR
jgi:hypothetical protein